MTTGWTIQGIDFILSKSPGFFLGGGFAQTLHLCTYKITCMCVRVCLSLHVFGRGVFNQIWPFITTVFLKYQNTIGLHAGAQYVYMHNSARRTCLNDNKNRTEHLKINSQSAARVLSSHWVYSQKWTISMWCECEVSNTSVPCWTELKSMYFWSSLQFWKKERKRGQISELTD